MDGKASAHSARGGAVVAAICTATTMMMAVTTILGCGAVSQLKDREVAPFQLSSAPPSLNASGVGAGPWNSEAPSATNRLLANLAPAFLALPSSQQRYGENACRALAHYFGNTGDDLLIDIDNLLTVPSVRANFDQIGAELAQWIDEIRPTLAPGSSTFASTTARSAIVTRDESVDWNLAMEGYRYYVTGEILTEGDDVSVEAKFHIWDHYNWDPGVVVTIDTPIGPIDIDQDRMGEFHRQGLAREFDSVGASTFHSG